MGKITKSEFVNLDCYNFNSTLKYHYGVTTSGAIHSLLGHYTQFKEVEDFYNPGKNETKKEIDELITRLEPKFAKEKALRKINPKSKTQEDEWNKLKNELDREIRNENRKDDLNTLQDQFMGFVKRIMLSSEPFYRSGHNDRVELYWKTPQKPDWYMLVIIPSSSVNENGKMVREVVSTYFVDEVKFLEKTTNLRYWFDSKNGEVRVFNYKDFEYFLKSDYEQKLSDRPGIDNPIFPQTKIDDVNNIFKTLRVKKCKNTADDSAIGTVSRNTSAVSIGALSNVPSPSPTATYRSSRPGLITEAYCKYFNLLRMRFMLQAFKFPILENGCHLKLEKMSDELIKLILNTEPAIKQKDIRCIEFVDLEFNADSEKDLQQIADDALKNIQKSENLIGTVGDSQIFEIPNTETVMVLTNKTMSNKETVRSIAFKTLNELISNNSLKLSTKKYSILV